MSNVLDMTGKATSVVDEYQELRNSFEARFGQLLQEFQMAVRETPVTTPPFDAIVAELDKRWQADCDVAARKGIELKRDAFMRRATEHKELMERQRQYAGPITEDVLEQFGFRRWSDGSFRTEEFVLVQVDKDWRLSVHNEPIGRLGMPFIVKVMEALKIRSLTPWNEETK